MLRCERLALLSIGAAALLLTACKPAPAPQPIEGQPPSDEKVTFHPLQSTVSPYETVTIEVDPRAETVEVIPHTAVIWVESENYPVSQLLWTVRCIDHAETGKGEIPCPPDISVVIRPKGECSKTLFGSTRGAEEGEIVIQPGDNACPSGKPNLDELMGLLKLSEEPGKPCAEVRPCRPGASLEMEEMYLRDSKMDYQWVYEVIVRRGDQDLFACDPEVWIEKEGAGG